MSDPIILSNNTEQALVPHGTEFQKEDEEESEYSSSEEENEADMPPGPVDPAKCTVGGPGTTGGSAQAPAYFHIQARDSRDKNLTEGGDYVVVRVIPGTTAMAGGAKEAEAIVKDNGDGSYTATYSVESRGDYQLTVEINGAPFGGSPFPVFFSPPDEKAAEAAFTDATGAVVDPSTLSAVSEVPLPVISVLGAAAYKARVKFPEDKDVLARTLLVGDMNPLVTLEQLQKLFSFSGEVEKCEFAGEKKDFCFITFTDAKEAEKALSLDKLLVIDRQLRVEMAQTTLDSKGQSGGTQYAALQMEQIQQLQRAQVEQHSLAAQVASMRVQAKQNPGPATAGLPQNSASQKAAALSAIAALSKRLAGSAPPGRDRDPAALPQKRRREVSPTLRYRGDRRSSPSRRRSPARHSGPVVVLRNRSPSRRRRSSSRDRRRGRDDSRSRRRSSKRSRSREARRRSRSRDASRRERSRKRSPERDSRRSRSTRRDSRRRSRSPERKWTPGSPREDAKRSSHSPDAAARKPSADPEKGPASDGAAAEAPLSPSKDDAVSGSPGRNAGRREGSTELAKEAGRSQSREARKRSRSREGGRRSGRGDGARRSRSREDGRRRSGREDRGRDRSPRSRRGGSPSRIESRQAGRRASSRDDRSRRDSPKRRDRELYSAEDGRSRRRREERSRDRRERSASPGEDPDHKDRSRKEEHREGSAEGGDKDGEASLANGDHTGAQELSEKLRERALEALKASSSAPADDARVDARDGGKAEAAGDDKDRKKRHKSKHHKKHKHQRREKAARKEGSPEEAVAGAEAPEDEAMPDAAPRSPREEDVELPEFEP